jgi:cardiolipin synthase A/B
MGALPAKIEPAPAPKKAKSQPRRWRQPSIPKRQLYRLAPKPPRRAGPELWDRLVLLVRSGWIWLALAAVLIAFEARWPAAAIGLLGVILLLFAPRFASPDYELDYPFGTDSAEFLTTLTGATGVPIVSGNRIAILNNGDAFYPAMLEALSQAEHSITMEQYIFWPGETGRRFAHAFAEKAAAGVSVKLLVDAIGSATIGNEILGILEKGGCQLAWYRPIRWYSLHRVNRRTHRKSLIVDGRIAFTGGAGIADQWLGRAQDAHHWRDIQVRLEGAAVFPLQTGFAQNWLETTGELLTGARYYPVIKSRGGVAVQTIMSSPFSGPENASLMTALAMLCSRRYLYISNPYFIPNRLLIEKLAQTVRRGVTVKVIVSGARNDTWLARKNSIRLYGKLLEAGVELYEYNRTMLHQKTMVVDGVWATVGTANFDNRSFALNEETNVCFYDPDLVDQMRDIFFADLAECETVTLEDWRRRGLVSRASELFAAVMQDLV